MIIKIIVGVIFYIMALMVGFLLGKEEMRKRSIKTNKKAELQPD